MSGGLLLPRSYKNSAPKLKTGAVTTNQINILIPIISLEHPTRPGRTQMIIIIIIIIIQFSYFISV